jgi:hypothetical protein
MATAKLAGYTFDTLNAYLGMRNGRTIGNNTFARRLDPDNIEVIYHRTPIVVLHRNGSLTLNSGGYRTMSTLGRLDAFANATCGYRVRQHKFEWYVRRHGDWENDGHPFHDGMTITGAGVSYPEAVGA